MSLFRRERRSISRSDFMSDIGDSSSPLSSGSYSAVSALALSAVVGCVRHRAGFFIQLPFTSFTMAPDGFPEPVKVQPSLIADPSASPRSIWLGQMSISRDLWGNAFGAILGRDAAMTPTRVEWLDPTKVVVTQAHIGADLSYTYNGLPYPAENMLLVPSSFNLPGSPIGLAPLHFSGLVELSRQAQEFGAAWWRNGAVPSAVLYAEDKDMTAEQAETVRVKTMSSWRGRRPAVLGAGWRLETTKVESQSKDVSETINAVALQVCQVFTVPPEELGIAAGGSSITYATLEQKAQAAIDRMNPDLTVVQDVLSRYLPSPQFTRANTGALKRSDLKGQYEAFSIATAGQPFLEVDEVRKIIDRRPMAPIPPTPQGGV